MPLHLREGEEIQYYCSEWKKFNVNTGCLELVYSQSERVKMVKFYKIIVVPYLKMDSLFLLFMFFKLAYSDV